MLKTIAIAAFLALPLMAQAADNAAVKPTSAAQAARKPKVEVRPVAPAASASAAPVATETPRQAQKRVQTRGSAMGRCLQLAQDQGLQGVERKQFLGTCVRQPQ